jgi:hypothetical protein
MFDLTVAATKTVEVIGRHQGFMEWFATDTKTICPSTGRFLHTIVTQNPWLQILLDQPTDVGMVVVYNREDICK